MKIKYLEETVELENDKNNEDVNLLELVQKHYSRDDKISTARISYINGEITDLVNLNIAAKPDEVECVEFFGVNTSNDGKQVFYHSSAHVLGHALVNLYNARLVNGPAIEEGFFYDVDIDKPISEKNFKEIEKEMLRLAKLDTKFVRKDVSVEYLREKYKENEFKQHFVNKIEAETTSVYRNYTKKGECVFEDMCKGPHIPSTGMIKSVMITKTSSIYFLNDSRNSSLQRVYGISFTDKKLQTIYKEKLAKAQDCDHRKLGREMNLFFFNELSPGSCFWMPKGAHVYNKLVAFIRQEYRRRGFKEVITPNIFSNDLWKISGHYDNYKDNMFMIEGLDIGMKSMNCPGHCLIFRQIVDSYKNLPLRLADFGVLHRNELSGALTGLTRVRRFQQDDAHIFVMKSQIKDEIISCLKFLDDVYVLFNFRYELFLSTRPFEKFIGSIDEWDKAEEDLKEAILVAGHSYTLNEGDGAFYGPKIDIILYDALGRKNQCATIQLDFQLPQRFDLKYKNISGEFETPVIIHRAILGSIERFTAILIENFGKKMPFWLTPFQIGLIPISEHVQDYTDEVSKALEELEVAVFNDYKLTLNKRIRSAEVDGYRLVCVVGKKEKDLREINVRFGKNTNRNFSFEEFLEIAKSLVVSMKEPEELFK